MSTLIYIGLLGVFAYNCSANGSNFKGSSASAKNMQIVAGALGYLVFFVALVWSFWPFTWWQPIVTLLASVFLGGFSAPIFQGNAIGIMVSPYLTALFAGLSIWGLVS